MAKDKKYSLPARFKGQPTDENLATMTNEEMLEYWEHQMRTLKKDGKRLAKQLNFGDDEMKKFAADIAHLKYLVAAEKKWPAMSKQQQLEHLRERHDQLTGKGANKCPWPQHITQKDTDDLACQIRFMEHTIECQEKWNDWSADERLAWLRECHRMITENGGAEAIRLLGITQQYIDETALRISIVEIDHDLRANWKKMPEKEFLDKAQRQYRLYTMNGGAGMRICGVSQDRVDELARVIRASQKVVAGETIARLEMDTAARRLMDSMQKAGVKSVYLPHSDILGKKDKGN